MKDIFENATSLFAEEIEQAIEANLASAIKDRPTYTKDGLLYCAICDEPMQQRVKPPINRIVNIDCLCDRATKEEREAKKRRDAADNRRKIAFGSANSKKLTFTLQTDDRRNPLASQQIATYCEHFSEHRKDGRGLLLYSVHNGGGKTFFASAAANELIDRGYAVRVTNFAALRDAIPDNALKNTLFGAICYPIHFFRGVVGCNNEWDAVVCQIINDAILDFGGVLCIVFGAEIINHNQIKGAELVNEIFSIQMPESSIVGHFIPQSGKIGDAYSIASIDQLISCSRGKKCLASTVMY